MSLGRGQRYHFTALNTSPAAGTLSNPRTRRRWRGQRSSRDRYGRPWRTRPKGARDDGVADVEGAALDDTVAGAPLLSSLASMMEPSARRSGYQIQYFRLSSTASSNSMPVFFKATR